MGGRNCAAVVPPWRTSVETTTTTKADSHRNVCFMAVGRRKSLANRDCGTRTIPHWSSWVGPGKLTLLERTEPVSVPYCVRSADECVGGRLTRCTLEQG